VASDFIALSRPALRELEGRLKTRIPGACISVLLRLLLDARHTEGDFQGIRLKRGEVLTGRPYLSRRTGLSEKSVRNALGALEEAGELIDRGPQRGCKGAAAGAIVGTLYLVVKYDLYDATRNKGATVSPRKAPPGGQVQEMLIKKTPAKKIIRVGGRSQEPKTPLLDFVPLRRDQTDGQLRQLSEEELFAAIEPFRPKPQDQQ